MKHTEIHGYMTVDLVNIYILHVENCSAKQSTSKKSFKIKFYNFLKQFKANSDELLLLDNFAF